RAPPVVDGAERVGGSVRVDVTVDGLQGGGHLLAVLVGHEAHAVADLVDDAGLHPRLREDGLDRLRKAGQAVDAADEDVADAAVGEVVEDGEPELGALALLPPDPEHLTVAVDADADRQVARARANRAVLADLDHQAVEVGDRVDGVQRPRAPRLDVGQDGVGDAADRVALDLNAVEIAEVLLDVAHAHPAGVEPEDPVVQAGQPGLALGHELGIEAAVTVARGAARPRPELGLPRLPGRAVAMVAGPARRRLPRRVAEVLGQLGAQRGLDHATGELAKHPARTGDLIGVKALQRLLELVAGQQTGQTLRRARGRALRRVGGGEISLLGAGPGLL